MFHNLRKSINTKIFNYFVKDVLNTSVVNCSEAENIVIVSQLCSRDLFMYLVAIKTFNKYIVPNKVFLVADRLSKDEVNLLHSQVNNLVIIQIEDVNTEGFPQGGTWERLLTILDLSEDYYVIQLDADTITFSEPSEVKQCIENNRSFTLGTGMGQKVISFHSATQLMKKHASTSQHVQVKAELAMKSIDKDNTLSYIRGCSGFAGFAKKGQTREQIKKISNALENKIGKEKWGEWGSEQVASNIVIANSNDPFVLPGDRYNYFKSGIDLDQFSFLHFVGSYRFSEGKYSKLAKQQLIKLNKK